MVLDMKGYVPPALAGLRDQLKGVDIRKHEDALAEWLPKAKAEADRVLVMYYGSGFGLRSIRKKFGDQIDAICIGGMRRKSSPQGCEVAHHRHVHAWPTRGSRNHF